MSRYLSAHDPRNLHDFGGAQPYVGEYQYKSEQPRMPWSWFKPKEARPIIYGGGTAAAELAETGAAYGGCSGASVVAGAGAYGRKTICDDGGQQALMGRGAGWN